MTSSLWDFTECIRLLIFNVKDTESSFFLYIHLVARGGGFAFILFSLSDNAEALKCVTMSLWLQFDLAESRPAPTPVQWQSATSLRERADRGNMTERNNTSDTTMTSSLGSVMTTYSRMMEEMRDPRVDSWLLMDSIWPTLSLSASYYLIVRHIGPRFMAKRWYW